jgi:hypothetical protein
MKKVLLAALVVLAFAPAAHAALPQVTMVARDVPLHPAARALAASQPRFNMVALHWQGPGVPEFSVRRASGGWTRYEAADDDWGRAGTWRMQGSPEWVGSSTAIRYRFDGRVTRLRAYFLWTPVVQERPRTLSLAGSPPIIPRSGWGADESIRRAAPLYADTVRLAIVHHTVNTNDYTPAQSAAIVRGIYTYHVKGNGWNDIGYNFLVDKYGQVFEGRYGGVDRPVVGAHSLGFNTGSVGVAVIGTYQTTQISSAAQRALVQLLAWRLDVAHVDPLSTATMTSGGNSKYPAGTQVTLHAISGHRDVYPTDCPGNALYARLPAIAQQVAATGLPKLYEPAVSGTIGGPIRFTGRLSSALPWTVTVTDATGAVVASGTGTSSTVDWTWDSTAAPPGAYKWEIDAPDVLAAGGTIGGKLAQLAITGAQATPSTLGAPGQGATVSYTLTAPAMVTATLLDSTGASVTTLFSEQRPAGKQSFTFAVDPSVADGAYTIQLSAQAANGQVATASIPIQVDRTITSFTTTPPVISPNGDGVQDSVTITFTLGSDSPATLQVLRGTTVVATLLDLAVAAGSPQTAAWSGPAPDGAYTILLTVGSVTRTARVVVDTHKPVLRALSLSHLRFAISKPAIVTLRSGAHVWTRKVAKPGHFAIWLRKVPRVYSVVARDSAGNVSRVLQRR